LGLDRLRIVRLTRWRAACLAGLSSVVLAACGGSGSSTAGGGGSGSASTTGSAAAGTSTPTIGTNPARANFIAKADQICADANRALTAPQNKVDAALKAEQAKGTTANRTALASAVRETSSVANGELDRLRALSPPSVDRQVVDAYIAAVADQTKLVDELASAVAGNHGSAVTKVGDELTAGKAKVDGLGQAYGFKVCGAAS
jgi:hypothetical protein